jgi:hypothetical protein
MVLDQIRCRSGPPQLGRVRLAISCFRGLTIREFLMSPDPNYVFCAKASTASYDPCPDVRFHALPIWTTVTTALVTFKALLDQSDLDHTHFGLPDWNPLGAVIPEGAKVVVNPNWVHHHAWPLTSSWLRTSGPCSLKSATFRGHNPVMLRVLHYVQDRHLSA